MSQQRKRFLLFVAIPLLLIFGVISVHSFKADGEMVMEEEPIQFADLEDILERGVLRAATDYSSTNYFIYRGEPMGFHLDLLKQFAAHLGVELEVSVSNDLEEHIDCLNAEGGSDLIARSLWVSNSGRHELQFTEPFSRTRQMLVQRKPDSWYNMHGNEMEGHMIRSQLDLAGKTVHVSQNSAFVTRLNHLMEEVGDTIHIVESDLDVEELIELVAIGDIDYTIVGEKLARLNEIYYVNIDAKMPVSFEQNLAWAVKPGADELLVAVNEWLTAFKSTRQYTAIYNKYYNNPRSVFIAKTDLHSHGGGNISVFDDYFKRYAEIVGWDWRLIASLSYQESRFNPSAVSWAGAYGIMQLMPGTAEFLNVPLDASVREHVAGGVRYLRWLDSRLRDEIRDDDERIKFVLASYNAGLGHVLDARRLAEKYDKDPNIWKDNVDYFLLNKSNPYYYLNPVVRHGYARGAEPYHYVSEIMERYKHYKNVLDVLAHKY